MGRIAGKISSASTATISLTQNLTALASDSAITINEDQNITLDLNGHVLNRGLIATERTATETESGSVIRVNQRGSLTIIDSSPSSTHKFSTRSDGLWVWDDASRSQIVKGGIITGGTGRQSDAEYNGGGIYSTGTLTFKGGSIIGNTATNGGGIYSNGTLTFKGGSIIGNTATNGGGIYTTEESINVLTGGIITDNSADTGGGLYYTQPACFAAGTMITMADGTKRAVETLNIGEAVRVFDHENGTVSSAPLFDAWKYPEKHSGVVTLHFTNDIDVTVVGGHSFFSREYNKYVAITKDNVNSYIGHEFYNADSARWETLTGYDLIDGEVDTYVITSETHLNCVANGMLSNEDGFYTILTNIFEYGEDLKIDAAKKADDIEKYGLWDFKNMKYCSRKTYDALNFQYMSIAFGKGYITPEAFAYLEEYWCAVDPELYCGTEEKTEKVTEQSELFEMSNKTLLEESFEATPLDLGVYIGGSLQIVGNNGGNLYLPSDTTVTLGTKTEDGDGNDNGIDAPTASMSVGVTTEVNVTAATDKRVAITNAYNIGDYINNFKADVTGQTVFFKNGTYYLAVPRINVIKNTEDNPVYGTAMDNENYYSVETANFNATPSLTLQWKHGDEWKSDSPATGLKVTASGCVETTAQTPAGSYTFRLTNGFEATDPLFVSSGEITLKVEKAEISTLSIIIATPSKGVEPSNEIISISDENLIKATGITWEPVHDKFIGSQAYTASISVALKNTDNYKFADSVIAKVNGQTATFSNGTVSYQFAALEDREVASIEIATKSKTNYTYGDDLDLSGLVIKVNYDDATSEFVAYDTATASFSYAPESIDVTTTQITITYGEKTATQSIAVSPKVASLSWGELEWTYDGSEHKATCSVVNLCDGDFCEVTLASNSITNAGTQVVTAASLSNGNYALPSNNTATLKVNKAPLTATASASPSVVIYGHAVPEYYAEYSGWKNGPETPETTPTFTCAYTTDSPVGTYSVTFNVMPTFDNYEVTTATGSVTVEPAVLTEAKAANQTYTGRELTPVITAKAGDLDATFTVGSWSDALVDPGTYTATVSGTGNFTGEMQVTFTIDPRRYVPSGGTTKVTKPAGAVIGNWTYLPATDKWTFTSNEGRTYHNEWGYVLNPYAHEGQSNISWFFFDANGLMLTGYQWIPSAAGGYRLFFLHPTSDGVLGRMYENEKTPEGYWANHNGWIYINGVVQMR